MLKRSGLTRNALRLIAIMALAAGCKTRFPQSTINFRVIDGTDGSPLADVEAVRTSRNLILMGIPFFPSKDGSYRLMPTGADGALRVSGLGADQSHRFDFSKPGYYDTSVSGDANAASLSFPPDDPYHQRDRQIVKPIKGRYVVRMYRQTIPVAQYEPVWTATDTAPEDVIKLAEDAAAKNGKLDAYSVDRRQIDRKLYTNQYGGYRVVWSAPGSGAAAGGRFWAWTEISPHRHVLLYASGGQTQGANPTGPESSEEWTRTGESSYHIWLDEQRRAARQAAE
jgi:hypothetical protein